MKEVLLLNKQIGETPLACMDRFRVEQPEYQGVKMTYAGRLDPIASGLLVVLAGDKVHEKESYLGLPKTYECVALLGVKTDTYDVLGVPLKEQHPPAPSERGGVEQVIQSYVGTFQQAYPPYSSKTVDGKQLHQIAREGNIQDVEIPERTVTVSKIWDVDVREISLREISRQIIDTVSRVTGDFRQQEISEAWTSFFSSTSHDTMTTLSFKISVSGGTYIRGIVNSLGEKLGCGACILSLHRTEVGTFLLDDVDKS